MDNGMIDCSVMLARREEEIVEVDAGVSIAVELSRRTCPDILVIGAKHADSWRWLILDNRRRH